MKSECRRRRRRHPIFVGDEIDAKNVSARRQARFHLAQQRRARGEIEVMKKIGKEDEIEVTPPIDIQRVTREHTETIGDARRFGVCLRDSNTAAQSTAVTSASGRYLRHLDFKKAVACSNIEHSVWRLWKAAT